MFRKMMNDEFPGIKHKFDRWLVKHKFNNAYNWTFKAFCKGDKSTALQGFKIKIVPDFTQVDCQCMHHGILGPGQLWWYELPIQIARICIILSFAGCANKAREMIHSILYHVSDIHSFPQLTLFPSCLHDLLPKRMWIPWGKGSTYYWILIIISTNIDYLYYIKIRN